MATVTSWITRRPHPDGIEACVRDTNINVWGIIQCRQLGWSDQRILQSIEGLTADDLASAEEYAASHPDEIEAFIRNNEEAEASMARFYADENFDRASVQALIALGHDVLTVQQAGQRGSTDPQVLAFATQDNRAVLAHDRYDFKRLHRLDPNHGGIVSCTRDADAAALAARIDAAVRVANVLTGMHLRINLPS